MTPNVNRDTTSSENLGIQCLSMVCLGWKSVYHLLERLTTKRPKTLWQLLSTVLEWELYCFVICQWSELWLCDTQVPHTVQSLFRKHRQYTKSIPTRIKIHRSLLAKCLLSSLVWKKALCNQNDIKSVSRNSVSRATCLLRYDLKNAASLANVLIRRNFDYLR